MTNENERQPLDERLIGRWRSESRADVQDEEDLEIEFHADGSLVYKILLEDRDQIFLLTYRTEDGFIISDQPSAPRKDRTAYSFTDDGKLMLLYGSRLVSFGRLD